MRILRFSKLKSEIISPPFLLLRVITPGILWFNLQLYKPPTARSPVLRTCSRLEPLRVSRRAKVPVFAKVPWEKRRAVSKNRHEAGTKCMRLCPISRKCLIESAECREKYGKMRKRRVIILHDISPDKSGRIMPSAKSAYPNSLCTKWKINTA